MVQCPKGVPKLHVIIGLGWFHVYFPSRLEYSYGLDGMFQYVSMT